MSSKVWKEYNLEDVIDKFIDYRGRTPKKVQQGIPLITAKIVKNGLIHEANEFIKCEDYDKWMTRGIPENGDVVLTTEAPLGEVAQINTNEKIALAQRIITLRGKKDILDNTFLRYSLQSPIMQWRLNERASGTTVLGIKSSELKRIKINIPIIDEQIRIAAILSILDKKIELNNKMNKTLEEMAQTLFKRWFIDFEFPNEEGEPYKSSGGEMVESEMGLIPKGWEVKLISEIIEIKDGTHASPKPKEEGYPLITSKHISGDKIDFSSANLISKEDYDEVNKRSKVGTGDILISMIGTVGLIHLVQEEVIDFAIKNVGLFKTSQKDDISEYLYLYLKSNEMKNYIEARLAGTTQKYISLGELRKIKFVLPSEEVINEFKNVIEKIFNKKRKNIEEIDSLIQLRDSLLPKLMSGEIRMEDIEANL